MSYNIICPYCDAKCDTYCDYLYDNDLYRTIEEPVEVPCPKCKKNFWLNAEYDVRYTTAKTEDEL